MIFGVSKLFLMQKALLYYSDILVYYNPWDRFKQHFPEERLQ